ncbi:SNF2 helicase associated domain-containing protein [Lacticaseibacillus sharpeae]|uniref:SNF2 helicase associated domain-containing protein n=1 Tax=Lacticaseibacillus sharpeae TaxID=1626 RepID=UPI001CDA8E5B|nr:SNF2 helicase associated domain-containing protein [Lacticaseibacillus sharpeae]
MAREEQDDYCSCPYFPSHGYCKHIAAVILYYKAQGQTIDDVLMSATVVPTDDAELLAGDAQDTSAGSRFVDNLGLTPVRYFHGLDENADHGPELELNLEIKEFEGNFGLAEMEFVAWLRVADASVHKFYLVRDITAFLDDYRTESRYYTSGKANFDLSAAAFTPAERALLDLLDNSDTVGIHEMTDDDSRYQRYARLDFASFTRLLPLLPKLSKVVFRPVDESVEYDSVQVEPFQPDAGLVTATVTADDAGYHLWVHNHVTNAVPNGRVLVSKNICYTATIDQFDAYDRLLMRANVLTGAIDADQSLDFAAADVEPLQELLDYLRQIGTVEVPDALGQIAMTPHFDLQRQDRAITLDLSFDYGDTVVQDDAPVAADMPRNYAKEEQAADYLTSLGFTRGVQAWQKDFPDADALYHFFTRELPNLRANGAVTVAANLQDMVQEGAALQTDVQVAENDGLLSVSFSFAGIDADEVDSVLKQLDDNQPYVQKSDGTLYIVDDQLKKVASA